jgi:hypothetical protein
MKWYEGKSVRNVKTNTGKLPDGFGFDGRGGGVIRELSAAEKLAQLKIMNHESA